MDRMQPPAPKVPSCGFYPANAIGALVSHYKAPDTVAGSAGFMEANSLTNSQELAELEQGGGSPPDAKSVKPAGGHAYHPLLLM